MLEIRNRTPFHASLLPGLDKDGRGYAIILAKGTFLLKKDADPLPLAEPQVPVVWADEYHGDPGSSSVKYESDTCLLKPGTDVVLLGHAYASRERTADVTLEAGNLSKTVRVFGDRIWFRSLGSWEMTAPLPFDRVSLTYERAFGGLDRSEANASRQLCEKRNPVGTGFANAPDRARLEKLPLPNLEDPRSLIRNWDDRPTPAGFGFIARNWMPRLAYSGTYDEAWQTSRCPLLPEDFDNRFFNAASPDLVARPHFKGGESVRIRHASPRGDLSFRIPRCAFDLSVTLRGKTTRHEALLDTVVIEPDESRLVLCWRATVACARDFLHIDAVTLTDGTSG